MTEIDLIEFEKWRFEKRSFVLIDVRDSKEHQLFNIGGRLAPLPELKDHLALFRTPLPIVVYCKRGIRSHLAIQRLKRWGEKGKFYNLKGGILPLLNKWQTDSDLS